MIIHHYKTSQEAYEKLNQYFLNEADHQIIKDGGAYISGQPVCYDTLVKIERAFVCPSFDFGNTFGYRIQKWSGLVNNYIDRISLEIFKSDVLEKENKKAKNYNISMPFVNNHAHGKNCLLSLTATRRLSSSKPIISFTLRSSEITKRLLMDLLLVQRIAEYIYGEEEVSLQMFVINMYQDPEAFCMLDSHTPIKDMLIKKGKVKSPYQKKIMRLLKKLKTIDINLVKYKVHKRCVRQLQRPNGHPLSGDRPMYSKQLNL